MPDSSNGAPIVKRREGSDLIGKSVSGQGQVCVQDESGIGPRKKETDQLDRASDETRMEDEIKK